MGKISGAARQSTLDARVRLQRNMPRGAMFELELAFQISTGITILFGPSGAGSPRCWIALPDYKNLAKRALCSADA
jgi:hypothetical protein